MNCIAPRNVFWSKLSNVGESVAAVVILEKTGNTELISCIESLRPTLTGQLVQ